MARTQPQLNWMPRLKGETAWQHAERRIDKFPFPEAEHKHYTEVAPLFIKSDSAVKLPRTPLYRPGHPWSECDREPHSLETQADFIPCTVTRLIRAFLPPDEPSPPTVTGATSPKGVMPQTPAPKVTGAKSPKGVRPPTPYPTVTGATSPKGVKSQTPGRRTLAKLRTLFRRVRDKARCALR